MTSKLLLTNPMSKKELKPLKLASPEQFKDFFGTLFDELYWANFYFTMFKEAGRLCTKHQKAVRLSPAFWQLTMRAYCQTAMVYLHRIYDQNRDSFNLRRFLLTIRENQACFDPALVRKRRATDPHVDYLMLVLGRLDPSQLEQDIRYTSNANPKVANLNIWRDRVTFHKDERELSRQRPFEDDHPLPYADIEELLSGGFRILNRYSAWFDTTGFSSNYPDWREMEFVFEALLEQHKGHVEP